MDTAKKAGFLFLAYDLVAGYGRFLRADGHFCRGSEVNPWNLHSLPAKVAVMDSAAG